LVEVRVQSLGLDPSSNTPVVILREVDGERVLPIWIGPGEASSIAMELASMKFTRPLTHDLIVSVIGSLGGTLKRVLITRVLDNTFYAEMIVQKEDDMVSIDARPSDSIAVALRTEARIFAQEELLHDTAVEVTDEDDEVGAQSGEQSPPGMDPDELKEHLRKLHPEDFGRFTP
jgi:bifunctional DNase/RNase